VRRFIEACPLIQGRLMAAIETMLKSILEKDEVEGCLQRIG
jgi:hypothetical protein